MMYGDTGHLLFSAVTTADIFVAINLEERDLLRLLGDDYRRYRQRTPMIILWGRRKPALVSARAASVEK